MADRGTRTYHRQVAAGRAAPLPIVLRPSVASRPAELRVEAGTVTIGSGSKADLVVDDSTVSRAHVELTLVPEGVHVKDLASRNGTFYAGQRISSAILTPGTRISLGAAQIAIELDAAHLAEPALHGGSSFRGLSGTSPTMLNLFATIARLDGSLVPVLVHGASGVGKELVARALHEGSRVAQGPLIPVNCGAISRELVASTLFGHKRGAFTGAVSDRLGLFRAADGGTVFLDEISEVSPSFQVSLLRFLQDGELKPLGSDRTITADVRIIAASNRPLKSLVAAGEFRRDLYYRLKGFELEVPSLRSRPEDIAALAEFFAAKHSEAMARKVLGISASALERLTAYDFPGNVRELENEIRRMVVLTNDGEYLTTRHLPQSILDAVVRPPTLRSGPADISGKTLKDKVESLEKNLVLETLGRLRWNQSRAADELGLSRVGLANKIKRYGLDREP